MIEWLVRLLNVCFHVEVVPMDWRGVCLVPLYKGNGDKYDSRGISLLNVLVELYGRILIKRV